jgi:hypothetical protein
MAVDNILHMVGNYQQCAACRMVVLVWLMDDARVREKIMDGLARLQAEVQSVTLICDRESLVRRWKNDRNCEWRTAEWLEASLASLPGFTSLENVIDTGDRSAEDVAEMILNGEKD